LLTTRVCVGQQAKQQSDSPTPTRTTQKKLPAPAGEEKAGGAAGKGAKDTKKARRNSRGDAADAVAGGAGAPEMTAKAPAAKRQKAIDTPLMLSACCHPPLGPLDRSADLSSSSWQVVKKESPAAADAKLLISSTDVTKQKEAPKGIASWRGKAGGGKAAPAPKSTKIPPRTTSKSSTYRPVMSERVMLQCLDGGAWYQGEVIRREGDQVRQSPCPQPLIAWGGGSSPSIYPSIYP